MALEVFRAFGQGERGVSAAGVVAAGMAWIHAAADAGVAGAAGM